MYVGCAITAEPFFIRGAAFPPFLLLCSPGVVIAGFDDYWSLGPRAGPDRAAAAAGMRDRLELTHLEAGSVVAVRVAGGAIGNVLFG